MSLRESHYVILDFFGIRNTILIIRFHSLSSNIDMKTQNGISMDTYFCLRPSDRLILANIYLVHDSEYSRYFTFSLFRMFHYPFLSNVEHTLNILEFCVLVDFQNSIHNSAQCGWRLSHQRSHEHAP